MESVRQNRMSVKPWTGKEAPPVVPRGRTESDTKQPRSTDAARCLSIKIKMYASRGSARIAPPFSFSAINMKLDANCGGCRTANCDNLTSPVIRKRDLDGCRAEQYIIGLARRKQRLRSDPTLSPFCCGKPQAPVEGETDSLTHSLINNKGPGMLECAREPGSSPICRRFNVPARLITCSLASCQLPASPVYSDLQATWSWSPSDCSDKLQETGCSKRRLDCS